MKKKKKSEKQTKRSNGYYYNLDDNAQVVILSLLVLAINIHINCKRSNDLDARQFLEEKKNRQSCLTYACI